MTCRLNLKKYSYKKDIIFVNFLFLLMWIIVVFYVQEDAGDYYQYFGVYNGTIENYFESGYYFTNLVAKKIGLNFFQYRAILVTISLMLMRDSIIKYSDRPVIVSLIYFIHPFIHECIVIRNSFSISLIIYSIRYLEKPQAKNIFKFLLCIILGMSFHISSLLYIILIIAAFWDWKKVWKFSFVFAFSCNIILYFFSSPIVHYVSEILHSSKIKYYLSIGDNRFMTRSMVVYLIIMVGLAFAYGRYGSKDKKNMLIANSAILISAYYPLMLVNYDYFRVMEYFWPVSCITVFNAIKGKTQTRWIYKMLYLGAFLSVTLCQSIIWIIDNQNAVLGNNILWNQFFK